MLKKLKKQLDKEIKKQYEKIEKNFMRFQNSTHSDLEERIKRLEEKFEQLSVMIQKDVLAKKSKESKKDKKKKDHKKDVVKNTNQKPADFTIITGLGEKMAQFLQDQGVHTYKQLSTLTTEKLEELNQAKKGFAARYKRYAWKNQAAELAKQ